MNILNRWVALTGMALLAAAASAQNPAYSSKLGLVRSKLAKDVPASVFISPEIAASETSSKPWLHLPGHGGKERVVAVSPSLNNFTAGNYNSKGPLVGNPGWNLNWPR